MLVVLESGWLNHVLVLIAPIIASTRSIFARTTKCCVFQESSNGPVKKSMREKAIERRSINKEHNSNFKAGYVPIEEERLHKTGLRGRKGNIAVCFVVLLFLLALINLIVSRHIVHLMYPLGRPSWVADVCSPDHFGHMDSYPYRPQWLRQYGVPWERFVAL